MADTTSSNTPPDAPPQPAPCCPRCGAEQLGHRVTDPDGRMVCGECGAAYDDPDTLLR